MKKSTLFFSLAAAMLSSACSSGEDWQQLLDKDLSHWRVYQSYQHTNDFRGRAPVDENGEKILKPGKRMFECVNGSVFRNGKGKDVEILKDR